MARNTTKSRKLAASGQRSGRRSTDEMDGNSPSKIAQAIGHMARVSIDAKSPARVDPKDVQAKLEECGLSVDALVTAFKEFGKPVKRHTVNWPAIYGSDGMQRWGRPANRDVPRPVLEKVATTAGGRLPTVRSIGRFPRNEPPRQPDPLRRQQIERAAVEYVTEHFTADGYVVDSKEKDNVGWDLEATFGTRALLLEVKGLSSTELCIELTPNEYAKMQEHRSSWRLCVVTNALNDPTLAMFAWCKATGEWEDQEQPGRTLQIEERVAARCRA